MTDPASGRVVLITTLSGTRNFLKSLGNIYTAFNVHKKSGDPDRILMNTSIDMLNSTNEFIKVHVENAKSVQKYTTNTLNGAQRTISNKT